MLKPARDISCNSAILLSNMLGQSYEEFKTLDLLVASIAFLTSFENSTSNILTPSLASNKKEMGITSFYYTLVYAYKISK